MSGLKDEHGVIHVPSDGIDGMSKSRQYALCDIMRCARTTPGSTYMLPSRNWGFEELEDSVPNCIECVAEVREAIGTS